MFRRVQAFRFPAGLLDFTLPWVPSTSQSHAVLSTLSQDAIAEEVPRRDYGMELLSRAKGLGWTAETMRKLRVHSMSTDKRIVEALEWLNSLGIGEKDAGDVVRRFPRVVSHKTESLQARVESLASKLNVSKAQAFQIFVSYPLVASKSDEKLATTFSYLSTLDIPPEQIAKMMCGFPPLLGLDIEAKVNSFRAVFEARCQFPVEERLVKLISTFPRALGISAEKISQKLDYLESIGVCGSQLSNFVASSVWGLSIEKKMKPNVDWLRAKGFAEEEIGRVVGRDKLFLAYSIEKLERNYEVLRKLELSEQEVVAVLVANPKLFGLALDGINMQSKLRFISVTLQQEVGPFIADFPSFLNLSLTKRLAPRHAYCRKCGLEGPLPKGAFTSADGPFCKSVVKRPLEEYVDFLTKWEASHQD